MLSKPGISSWFLPKALKSVLPNSLKLILPWWLLWAEMVNAAAPVITGATLEGGNPAINIQSDIGMMNQVQFAEDLAAPDWLPLTNLFVGQSPYSIIDSTATLSAHRYYRLMAYPTNAPAGMARIPAGSFHMGDTFNEGDSSELPVHTVYVSAFYMETHLVDGALWNKVYYWANTNGYNLWSYNYLKAQFHPVLDWDKNAIRWCNARSEMERLTPCYYTDPSLTVVSRNPYDVLSNACVNWMADGYRLPTEAEWEKAARGGLNGRRFPWGDTISHFNADYFSTNLYAYDVSSTRGYNPFWRDSDAYGVFTSPITYYAPNGYGLRDMCGNVRQWCWDTYSSTYYGASPAIDPHGPDEAPAGLAARVVRSTSWGSGASGILGLTALQGRCAARYPLVAPPGFEPGVPGFRCVRRVLETE